MHNKFLLIISLLFFVQCSLDTKTGIWTKSKILEEKQSNLEEIFESEEILEEEFNSNIKIRLNSSFAKNSFLNNLTNNSGYINFESDF